MNRRAFATLLGGAAAAWPLAVRAQQPGKLPTIGFLGAASASSWSPWVAAFVQRLRELGWIEGRNIAIDFRWAEGRTERMAEIAAEFVRLKVDVIVTGGLPAVAAKQATSVIPIVLAVAADPLGTGLVASLARPGGNVTGLSTQARDLASKRLELLREVVSGLRRLAILTNVGYPSSVLETSEVQAAARTLGLEVVVLDIRRAEDITPAFKTLKDRAEALYVTADPLLNTRARSDWIELEARSRFFTWSHFLRKTGTHFSGKCSNRIRINTLANVALLPTIANTRDFVEAGSLMSYGPNYSDLFRRAGDFVHKILHGAKPGDIPVEQPTRFDLVINVATAKALGLEVPPMLLARADEVIE